MILKSWRFYVVRRRFCFEIKAIVFYFVPLFKNREFSQNFDYANFFIRDANLHSLILFNLKVKKAVKVERNEQSLVLTDFGFEVQPPPQAGA